MERCLGGWGNDGGMEVGMEAVIGSVMSMFSR